jgi:hypothetical protein
MPVKGAIIHVSPDSDHQDIEVRLTALTQQLVGVIEDATGARAADCAVVLLSDAMGEETMPEFRVARPATDGTFAFSGLAAGPYAIALVSRTVIFEEVVTQDILASVRAVSVAVQVGAEGEVVRRFRME